MNYEELVKKLRDLHRDPHPASAEWLFENQVALYDAAAAIEELIESVHIRDKIWDELNHYLWKLEAAQPHWVSVDELPKEKGWYYLGYLSKWNGQEWWVPQFPDYWTKPPQEVQDGQE